MTTPNAQEVSLLRSRPHNTKLYLSIFQPREVFSGQITGSVAKGDQVISIYNTTGTSAGFVSGMTMLVGTTPGGYDKGRIRAKALTTGTVTVAENSHIDWQPNDYIRVIGFFEIWPIYPRIIQDPSDATKTLWYKDYNIEYTNQNSSLGYFICMGPHQAKILENGSCQIYYSAEGTEHVRSDETGTSYYWGFGGGAPSTSNAKTPGWVAYSSPGFFTTRLVVSGSVTQSSNLSDRHVAIYNPIGSGGINPIYQWELTGLGGSRDQGGYTASIRIFEDVSGKVIRDGSLVVIFSDDHYGGTNQSIGGNAFNNSDIMFVGYILDGTIKYNYKDSYIDFDIGSVTEFMKMAEGFSVSVQDSDDPAGDAATNPDIPSGWVAVLDMDIKRALYHYLKWHSTVLVTCDFQYVGTNQKIQYFDADRTSIYDAINTLISSAVVGGIVCDRQGKIWAETDIYVTTGTYNTNMEITKIDWMNEPVIEDRMIGEVSYLELGGIAYNGTTFEALMSAAPGVTPAYRGKIQRLQGLALESQTQLNTLAGNLYAQLNARYPNVEISLAGNYRNFDIAPQEVIPLTINQDDTILGISFNRKSFFINSMRWDYNPKAEALLPVIGLEELASGYAGDTLEIPDVPPIENPGFGGFVIPPIVIPPIIIPPFPIFSPASGTTLNKLLVNPQFGWNTSAAIEATRYNVSPDYYYICTPDEINEVNGAYVFPPGSTVAIEYAIFKHYTHGTDPPGNIAVEIIDNVFDLSGTVTLQPQGGFNSVIPAKTVDGIFLAGPSVILGGPGYINNWSFIRDGDDALDTFNSNLLAIGLVVTFS